MILLKTLIIIVFGIKEIIAPINATRKIKYNNLAEIKPKSNLKIAAKITVITRTVVNIEK